MGRRISLRTNVDLCGDMNVDSGREAQGKDFPAAVQLFSQNHKVLETEKFGKCYEVSC